MKDISLKLVFNILKNYMTLTMIYTFCLKVNIEKVEKLVTNLHDKQEYVIQITKSNQPLNHKLVSEKMDRVIKCNENTWLRQHTDMNTGLKNAKNDFEDFFKLMDNTILGKAMENVRKHGDS